MRPKPRYMQSTADSEQIDAVIMSVRLESGGFESSLRIPLPMTQADMENGVSNWLAMMLTGLQIKATRMTAEFDCNTSEEAR